MAAVRSAAVLSLAVLAASCGDAEPPPSAPPAPGTVVARWHRGAEAGAEGRPIVVDAVRPCVVSVSVWEDGVSTLRNRRELSPGDVEKVAVGVRDSGPPPGASPPAAAGSKASHAVSHVLHFAVDDAATSSALVTAWTESEKPWVRVQAAEVPPVPLDLADGARLVVLGVAVAEPVAGAEPRLDLSWPPRLLGTKAPARKLAVLVLSVEAR
jgi:hypothetical protein